METSLSLLAGASGPGNVLIFSNISPPYCVPAVGCLYPGTLPGSPGTLTLSPWQELFLLSFAGQILNMVQLYLSDTFYTSFTVRKQADCWRLLVSHRGFENPHFFSFLCVSISMYQNMFASENWPISTDTGRLHKGIFTVWIWSSLSEFFLSKCCNIEAVRTTKCLSDVWRCRPAPFIGTKFGFKLEQFGSLC